MESETLQPVRVHYTERLYSVYFPLIPFKMAGELVLTFLCKNPYTYSKMKDEAGEKIHKVERQKFYSKFYYERSHQVE